MSHTVSSETHGFLEAIRCKAEFPPVTAAVDSLRSNVAKRRDLAAFPEIYSLAKRGRRDCAMS
jgi:hypothetical protein